MTRRILLFGLTCLAAPLARGAASAKYTIAELPLPTHGVSGAARAINNRAQAVGWADRGAPGLNPLATGAFLWQSGGVRDLVTDEKYPLPAAIAINDRGDVLIRSEPQAAPGQGLDIAVPSYTLLWRNGTIIDLNGFPAAGLNNRGQVVGYATPPGKSQHQAAVWRDGKIRHLGVLPGDETSIGQAINDAGQVTGVSSRAETSRPFLWDGKKLIDIGVPHGSRYAHGQAINRGGQVLVWAWSGDPKNLTQHSYLWSSGRMTRLGGVDPNGRIAYGLNDAGDVVGNDGRGAFLWSAGTLTHLRDVLPPGSGWKLQSANGINSRGQIVGWGEREGKQRPFLLTPR